MLDDASKSPYAIPQGLRRGLDAQPTLIPRADPVLTWGVSQHYVPSTVTSYTGDTLTNMMATTTVSR